MLRSLVNRCDALLDWWEFTAARYLWRHFHQALLLALLVMVLAGIYIGAARAEAETETEAAVYAIVPAALLTRAAALIEELQSENAALRARHCNGVAI